MTERASPSMPVGRRCSWIVSFAVPPGATLSAAREYVRSALATERGQLDPLDPMVEFDPSTIRVDRIIEDDWR